MARGNRGWIMARDASDAERDRDRELARRLTSIAWAMDAFERRTAGGSGPLDDEGLIPIFLGQDLVETASFAAWEEVDDALARLRQGVGRTAASPRRDYLLHMVGSLQAASMLFQGGSLTYADKLESLVGVPAAPVAEQALASMRDELDVALSGAGERDGSLRSRLRRWQERLAVPTERLPGVISELMLTAKARTDATIFDTGDYTMGFEPVRGVPFSARCDFVRRRMDLNVDLSFTRPGLKHLVCHEAFPGHATQLLYTKEAAASGRSPSDVLLCTANSVTGALQEGIGEQGIHLIEWIEDEDDIVHEALRRLRSSTQTSMAWHLMEGDWTEDRAARELTEGALGEDAWAQGRIRFARHAFRGPFLASYWYGDEAVREVRGLELAHDDLVDLLYGSLNSVASLRRSAGIA